MNSLSLNPKSEYRISKQYRNHNFQNSKPAGLKHSDLENSDLFRISNFEIRIYSNFAFIILFCLLWIMTPVAAQAAVTMEWGSCLSEAAKHHPDLIVATEVIVQAKDTQWQATSPLEPQVTGNFGLSRQLSGGGASSFSSGSSSGSGSASSPGGSFGSGRASDTYSYNISASQLIFDGFQTVNNIKAASENVKAKKEAYKFTSATVRFRLRSAFANLLKSQAAVLLYEDIIKIRKASRDFIQLRYESGMEHKGALMQAEANVAQAEYNLAQARRSIVVSRRQLAKEMGLINDTDVFVNGEFTITQALAPKPDLESITQNHPSVLQQKDAKDQADYNVKSAVGSFLPQVNGQGGLGRSDSKWPPERDQWNIGFTVAMPFFDGGLRLAQLAQAQAVLRQAVASLQSTHDSVITTLESSWAALIDGSENIGVQEALLGASSERYKIGKAQYSVGLMSFDNWIIIENDLVNAKIAVLNAQANALLAEAQWIQAKGETVEYVG